MNPTAHQKAIAGLLVALGACLWWDSAKSAQAADKPETIRVFNAKNHSWKAGAAAVTITPKGPMWRSGYARPPKPATETEHAIWAKALALEDHDGNRAVLVTLDLVGIDRATSAAICDSLMKKHSLTRDRIALNCSHNHSGPAVGRNLRGLFFLGESDWRLIDEYTDWLRGRVVAVVDNAFAQLAPATLARSQGRSDIAVNRRNNPHDDVVTLRAQGKLQGPSDHDVPILRVSNPEGCVEAIVFGYACHPTKLSYKFEPWCGDYAGFAQIEIENAHPGAIAMFWQGCGGDQTPWPRGDGDVEKARTVGRALAAAVEEGLDRPLTTIEGGLETRYREIDLPLDAAPQREQLEAAMRGRNAFKARIARNTLDRLEAGKTPRKSYQRYPVQTWRLGSDLRWIFLGGEVVVDYALRFKKEFGETNTWVAGYSNDVMAYVPSERVLSEGGYEGGASMVYYDLPAAWAPGIEERIAREALNQMTSFSTNKNRKTLP